MRDGRGGGFGGSGVKASVASQTVSGEGWTPPHETPSKTALTNPYDPLSETRDGRELNVMTFTSSKLYSVRPDFDAALDKILA